MVEHVPNMARLHAHASAPNCTRPPSVAENRFRQAKPALGVYCAVAIEPLWVTELKPPRPRHPAPRARPTT
eukprot:3052939-Alexandrium_andersonii.AAC.1